MNEPIYSFVPGQGWIPKTTESFTRTVRGRIVKFTERAPESGEFYYCIGRGSSVYLKYKTFEERAEWVAGTIRMSRILRGEAIQCARAEVETDQEYFITIEVLD